MPVYEYRCKSCGKTHEIEHGFNDKRPTECPSCGGQLVRVFHPIGLVFKGSGFHKTDYGGSSSRAPSESKPSGSSAEAKSSDGSTSSSGGDPKPSSDSRGSSTPAKPRPSDSSSGKT